MEIPDLITAWITDEIKTRAGVNMACVILSFLTWEVYSGRRNAHFTLERARFTRGFAKYWERLKTEKFCGGKKTPKIYFLCKTTFATIEVPDSWEDK